MICKNVKQMIQTTLRNAIPMHRQGYSYRNHQTIPTAFYVDKSERDEHGNPKGYNVDVKLNQCNCQFWQENRPHFAPGETTCKHIEWVRSCEEENARIDAMVAEQEAIDDYRAEAENFRTVATAERAYQDACHTHR